MVMESAEPPRGKSRQPRGMRCIRRSITFRHDQIEAVDEYAALGGMSRARAISVILSGWMKRRTKRTRSPIPNKT